MECKSSALYSYVYRWLIMLLLLTGLTVSAAQAETVQYTLTPDDLAYEDGNIVLHKQAERIGPDEWQVTVRATIGEVPVEKRKMEVVFVLDCSGSMAWCTDEEQHNKGSHSHGTSCYRIYNCGQVEHTHTYGSNGCCSQRCSENNHGNEYFATTFTHSDGTVCGRSNRRGNWYKVTCAIPEHSHNGCSYTTSSQPQCGRDVCTHSNSGATACTYKDANGNTVQYKTRLQAAQETIASMVKKLTQDGADNVVFKYVIFSSSNYDNGVNKTGDTKVVSNFSNLTAEGGTQMYNGIKTGINQFSNNEYKKVLVVLTDGEANDNASVSSTQLSNFKKADGTVFTVGFAYSNSVLEGIAGGTGGKYVHAGDEVELNQAMKDIETVLTAMLEDPMGAAVGFTPTSIEAPETTGGIIDYTEDTIYWRPSADGSGTVNKSTIEYSYKVKLNEQANTNVGVHGDANDRVPLNKETYFYYGIKKADNTTDMKAQLFPLPYAEYHVSSVQTKWQVQDDRGNWVNIDVDGYEPTDVEKIVGCDYKSTTYIAAFEQDYKTITPVIKVPNSNDYYRYTGTVVTATDESNKTENLTGVDDVDATKAKAYTVVHQYELVKANQLIIGGTKTLIGRNIRDTDRFKFTITAVTAGAPMPKSATVEAKSISGNSAVFEFDAITFNAKGGPYTYIIKEVDESSRLTNVEFDPAEHRLVVTVEEKKGQYNGKEFVVSYTLDGVPNGHLAFANRLKTGTLQIEKKSVASHLDEHQQKVFGFLVYVQDVDGRPLNGSDYQLRDGTPVTFTSGYATVSLNAGQSAEIMGLPDGATYQVTEDVPGGFTVTPTEAAGTIVAGMQQKASFENAYASKGQYKFVGSKVLKDAAGNVLSLEQGQFSFVVLDENGNQVSTTNESGQSVDVTGRNNTDGSIYFDMLLFTQEDIGKKKYIIVEEQGQLPGIIYDTTRHEVNLTISDNGDGTLSIVSDKQNESIVFNNLRVSHPLTVRKEVAGNMGSKNREFSFVLHAAQIAGKTVSISLDGGVTFAQQNVNAQGTLEFTLKHSEQLIVHPVTGQYTVTETDAAGYEVKYTINGVEEVGREAAGTNSAEGSLVTFVNTLEPVLPTGIKTPYAGALAGLILGAALLAINLLGRRWMRIE